MKVRVDGYPWNGITPRTPHFRLDCISECPSPLKDNLRNKIKQVNGLTVINYLPAKLLFAPNKESQSESSHKS